MNIESMSSVPAKQVDYKTSTNNAQAQNDENTNEVDKEVSQNALVNDSGAETPLDTETKRTLDKASGLIQSIVSDKMTKEVIRKIPSDEYLKMLNMLDDIVNGFIHKEV